MILGLYKVSGHSMLPHFKPKDRVLVSSLPYLFSKPAIGDAVLLKSNDKILIKRISKFEGNKIIVSGDNKSDSLKIGSIDRGNILGKVIFILNT